ncbi:methyltransferase domain-containing protein [Thermococcus argininiproducens]|uniref:Methyltransferase domain-containing protein n=1 Tax=Thermococcus argininiproducens TaxID=2866384 RepID=A0A9E7MAM9_9EURY|nr:methyltransferase domain-containing protein [Thermococcus argininiproducens]USH00141.1 methyltransferase domain-containing protein [Thermococcus argininiproducens]
MIPSISEVKGFLKKLGFDEKSAKELVEQIEYFEIEAPERDDIVREYLRDECIETIVNDIVKEILKLNKGKIKLLDVAAGSGFFTERVKRKLEEKDVKVEVYGFDITPSMLKRLNEKGITPIWGVAEKIKESIEIANEHYSINAPKEFDIVLSTLAFHHFLNPNGVLESMKSVLKESGRVIIVDVLKHEHEELKETLKDTHLGFSLEEIKEMGSKIFKEVKASYMDVYCEVGDAIVGLYKAVFA